MNRCEPIEAFVSVIVALALNIEKKRFEVFRETSGILDEHNKKNVS